MSTVSRRYTIVICPRCGTPRIVDLASKTTRCTSCGRLLTLKKMRHYGGGDTPHSLMPLIARLNSRRGNIHTIFRGERINFVEIETGDEDGESGESEPQVADENENPAPHQSHSSYGGKDRISRLRREIERLENFTIEDFTAIFVETGGKREKAVDALRALMESGEVYSPERGVFRFIGGGKE